MWIIFSSVGEVTCFSGIKSKVNFRFGRFGVSAFMTQKKLLIYCILSIIERARLEKISSEGLSGGIVYI